MKNVLKAFLFFLVAFSIQSCNQDEIVTKNESDSELNEMNESESSSTGDSRQFTWNGFTPILPCDAYSGHSDPHNPVLLDPLIPVA